MRAGRVPYRPGSVPLSWPLGASVSPGDPALVTAAWLSASCSHPLSFRCPSLPGQDTGHWTSRPREAPDSHLDIPHFTCTFTSQAPGGPPAGAPPLSSQQSPKDSRLWRVVGLWVPTGPGVEQEPGQGVGDRASQSDPHFTTCARC